MKSLRIIYITPSFQHPRLRGSTRCYHFIKELSRRHSITLLSPALGEVPAEAIEDVTTRTEKLLIFRENGVPAGWTRTMSRLPLLGGRLGKLLQRRKLIKEMKKSFQALVEEQAHDVVIFHGKNVFEVVEHCSDLPVVVDFCDATSMRVLARMRYSALTRLPLMALRYLQVRRLERKLIRKSRHVAFISSRDREAILGPSSTAKIIAIGVDRLYWKRKGNRPSSNAIVFTGVMDYAPNEDAALFLLNEILPLIRKQLPQTGVYVVGRSPSPRLIAAATERQDVTVTGYVEDVRPYLESAKVFVAPLRYGSGIQNKVLEAMAMELPVVATPIVAEGLRVQDAEAPPIRVASRKEEFSSHVIDLLENQNHRSYLGTAGRRFVEKYFDWERSAELLEGMCHEAVSQGKASGRIT